MPTVRVYVYGLLPPVAEAERVAKQMSLSHAYYNKLIELELRRRESVRKVLESTDSTGPLKARVQALDEAIERGQAEIRKLRATTRKRSESAEQRATLRAQYAERKLAYAELKEAKAALKNDELSQIALECINVAAKSARQNERAAYVQNGGYWGSYLVQEQAFDEARKSPTPPNFRHWDGSGTVAVQFQHGASWEELVGSTLMQIGAERPCGSGKGKARPVLRLRVGSDEGRAPIWAEWPLILHRPVPESARIMWAKVIRRRLAGKEKWELQLTLNLPDGWKTEVCGSSGPVAINFGWRKRELPGGKECLRVAYIRNDADDGGEMGEYPQVSRELLVDDRTLTDLRKVDDLLSIRTKLMNEMKAKLGELLLDRILPAWFDEETDTISQWKSAGRFAKLAIIWRDQRWEGDEEVYDLIEAWRIKDKHLWTWQDNLRDQVLRHRKYTYMQFAVKLARTYDTLVLEKFDLAEIQKHEDIASEKTEIQPARARKRLAAPGELRECLVSAFLSRGGKVVYIDEAYNTQRCHACGYGEGDKEQWNAIEAVEHTCERCHATWDQDDNACRNLIKNFLALDPARTDGEVDIKESKWGKLGRHTKDRSKVGTQNTDKAAV